MDQPISYALNTEPAGQKNKTMLIIIVVIVALLLAGGAYFFFMQKKPAEQTKTIINEKESPSSTPSPTSKPIDKSKIKIKVLNGTGTPGEAKKAVDALVEAGYKAENITTDNAEDYDHTKATIEVKKDSANLALDIQKSLTATFSTIEIGTKELESSSEFDAVVTTGGKLFETPTSGPTSKPTTSSSSPTPTSSTSTTPTSSPTPTP